MKNLEGQEYLLEYQIGKEHGIHVIQTTVTQYEIKKYGVSEVVKYHAKRLGIEERYSGHIHGYND